MRRPLTLLILVLLLMLPLQLSAAAVIDNPIGCKDFQCIFLNVIRVFLGLLAVIATFVFVYGGFLMLTSGGNPEMIKKARETLFWATIGIITVLGSWVFIRFVLKTLTSSVA